MVFSYTLFIAIISDNFVLKLVYIKGVFKIGFKYLAGRSSIFGG
jgi:hypothetical protein